MTVFRDKALIEEVATLKNTSAAFVEKDWYAVQLLKKINEFTHPGFEIIFSGGTALSKAHRLISRFSEDLDYRVQSSLLAGKSSHQQRRIRSRFKRALLSHLETTFEIDDNKLKARDGNRFFSVVLSYLVLFPSAALRPHLLVEFKQNNLAMAAETYSICSFINELSQLPPEIDAICDRDCGR